MTLGTILMFFVGDNFWGSVMLAMALAGFMGFDSFMALKGASITEVDGLQIALVGSALDGFQAAMFFCIGVVPNICRIWATLYDRHDIDVLRWQLLGRYRTGFTFALKGVDPEVSNRPGGQRARLGIGDASGNTYSQRLFLLSYRKRKAK